MFNYENVGSKIKSLAIILCAVGVGVSIAVAIFMFYLADEYYRVEEVYYTLGGAILVLGPFSSWISSLLLYGFGELIDKAVEIERNTRDDNKKSSVQAKVDSAKINELENLRYKGLITEEEYLQAVEREKV